MKVFKFCNKQLTFVPYSINFYAKLISICTFCVLILSTLLSSFYNSYHLKLEKSKITEELKVIVLKEENRFEKHKMIKYLKNLNIKFPFIVYAQALLESSNFKSQIFQENNNMFGMKVASARQSTNVGEQYEHAVFDTWKDCVLDYALYQARYLNNIKTEEQYFTYLENTYAEDTNYVTKLKAIINNQKIKQLFNEEA